MLQMPLKKFMKPETKQIVYCNNCGLKMNVRLHYPDVYTLPRNSTMCCSEKCSKEIDLKYCKSLLGEL